MRSSTPMRSLLVLASLTLTASLTACGGSHHSDGAAATAPSATVRPDISDPLCNGGRGVRLHGLRGDAVVASATMPDGSTLLPRDAVLNAKAP
jgi:hypothetical protein